MRILFLSTALVLMGCAQEHDGHSHSEADHENAELHTSAEVSSEHSAHGEADHSVHNETARKSETTTVTTRSADSHSHGGAVLSVAADNNAIVMELETPLYNLLGFEYAPKTPEEKTRVSEVEARLARPENLMSFNAEAGCTYDKPVHKIMLFEERADHEHDEDHDSDHDEDRGSDNDEDHDSDHKDIILEYGLKCKAMSKLKKIEVSLFEEFPFSKELELVYLGPSQQMSVELSSSRPNADLTR